MNNETIKWCCNQKKGIRMIEPNEEMSKEYFKSSNEDILNMEKVSGKWVPVTAYYACYESLYALLCKIGIKCEIHDCSLELMEILGYESDMIHFIKDLKKNRIDSQYYLETPKPVDSSIIKEFIETTKKIALELNSSKIEKIRNNLK